MRWTNSHNTSTKLRVALNGDTLMYFSFFLAHRSLDKVRLSWKTRSLVGFELEAFVSKAAEAKFVLSKPFRELWTWSKRISLSKSASKCIQPKRAKNL